MRMTGVHISIEGGRGTSGERAEKNNGKSDEVKFFWNSNLRLKLPTFFLYQPYKTLKTLPNPTKEIFSSSIVCRRNIFFHRPQPYEKSLRDLQEKFYMRVNFFVCILG